MNHFTLITNTITAKGGEVLSKPTTCTKAGLEVDRIAYSMNRTCTRTSAAQLRVKRGI